jgi:hypothetical protein
VRGTLWNILEGSGARWVRFALFEVRGTLWNILEGSGARWVRFALFEVRGAGGFVLQEWDGFGVARLAFCCKESKDRRSKGDGMVDAKRGLAAEAV